MHENINRIERECNEAHARTEKRMKENKEGLVNVAEVVARQSQEMKV